MPKNKGRGKRRTVTRITTLANLDSVMMYRFF